MTQTNLTETEEKTLVGLLYNTISFGTTQEVFGELNAPGAERLQSFRVILGKLIRKFSLEKQLDPQTLLLLGMTGFIENDVLKNFSKSDNNHLKKRAGYFLNK